MDTRNHFAVKCRHLTGRWFILKNNYVISMNRYIGLFALVILLLTTKSSLGQYFSHYDSLKFDRDKQQRITLDEFYGRVDNATKL